MHELYGRLKDAIKGCFELSKPGQRDYDRFVSFNLLRINIVSGGSLPSFDYQVIGDRVGCVIVAADWSKNDILRFICLSSEQVEFEDIVMESPANTTIMREVPPDSLVAFVHLRDSRKGRLASTQRLIFVNNEVS